MGVGRAIALVFHLVIWPFAALTRLAIAPFVSVGRFVRAVLALPMSFLAQFETLAYFLGSAILIGVFSACVIYGILQLFVVVLDLDRKPVPKPIPATGHDAISYRAARAEKKQKKKEGEERRAVRAKLLASQPLIQEVVREAKARPIALSSPLSPNTGTAATRSGLFRDIILEQTDEESDNIFGA